MFGWFKKSKPEPTVGTPNYWPYETKYERDDDPNVLILDTPISPPPVPVPPPVVRDEPRPRPKPRIYTEDEIAARAIARQRDRETMNAARK